MPRSVPTAPRLVVCSDEATLACVVTEYAVSGWFVRPTLTVEASPWQMEAGRVLCTGSITDALQTSDVAELLTRGQSVAVAIERPDVAAQVYDQCRRLAEAAARLGARIDELGR